MAKQLLHLVFGGELTSLDKNEFKDLSKIHVVGLYPNYARAKQAWRAAAQSTVDNALMRYYVVHLHRLLDPDQSDHAEATPRGKPDPVKKTGAATKARSTAGAKAGKRK